MPNHCLPTKELIKTAIVDYLLTVESATTSEINLFVINHFHIPKETYTEENDYGNTTIFAYRMCWIRTELRNEGRILNVSKGVWRIKR